MFSHRRLQTKLILRQLKIIAGSIVLVLILFAATSGTTTAETTLSSKELLIAPKAEKRIVSAKEAHLYNVRKEKLKAAITIYFKNAISSGDILGAGVSVVKGDSIVLSDGYGKRNYKSIKVVNGETVFRLGSLSKGFAGVLAASIQHENLFSWNDKVVDFLPEFQLGDSTNTSKITLAHILSHTSGAPYHSFTNLVEADLPMSNIAGRFTEVSPISSPGTQYSYQNALFALSGEILLKTTGKETTNLLNDRFFEPLGMRTVSMNHKDLLQIENIALPHSKRGNGWKTLPLRDNYYNATAAGGINASALDMGKWMRFLLGHNSEVMEQSAFKDAFNPFIEIGGHGKYYHRWPGHTKSSYGFGWRIHNYVENETDTEKTIWHHGGSVNSYRNEIALYPEDDLGICVLINSNSRLARTVIPDLHKIVKRVYKETAVKVPQNSTAGVVFLD